MQKSLPEPDFIQVGQIVGTHGLKGQIKIRPLTEFLERFAKGARLRLDGNWIEVETSTIHKGRPLIKLFGIDSIDAAEPLRGHFLESNEQPELAAEDEFLADDLIGLAVFTEEGEELGEVEEVLQYPAHEILQVDEILIPLVQEFIVGIDFDAERITVRLLPGMRPGED